MSIFLLADISYAFSQDNEPVALEQDAQSKIKDTKTTSFDPLSAASWMQRLADTVHTASFEVVYVVSTNKRETLPYMWRKGKMADNSAIEQLSLLNGPGFEQVAHKGKVSIFEPGYPPYSVRGNAIQGPIPLAFIHNDIDFTKSYSILLMGRNRIAGRMAQQIRVISRDKTRFGYHLWLDEQSGLLLKLDMYNLDGSLLEQIQVTQLRVSNDVDEVFKNVSVDQLPQISPMKQNVERPLSWQVGFLPKGMEVLKQDLHRIERTGQVTEYMLLSDGLVDVSVYVMKANDAFQEDMAIASNSHAVVSKTDGRIQVTVVGEVPVSTAERIASSIVLSELGTNEPELEQESVDTQKQSPPKTSPQTDLKVDSASLNKLSEDEVLLQ